MYITVAIILAIAVGIFLYRHNENKSLQIQKIEKISNKHPIYNTDIKPLQDNIEKENQDFQISTNSNNNSDKEIPINKITIDDKTEIDGNDSFSFGKNKEIKIEITLADDKNNK
ncbi:hypothetical protein [Caminicella sporogenes]|uniref:hypothetical protein n=1 Tax=Caminicella sporogenes TaxID=166485 RepID=UPI0025403674|nr:hypothetical protein [Caminicella sporogenes]WIF95779.1 hypothetical protein QNI18_03960 [Caminicella sporogenes]